MIMVDFLQVNVNFIDVGSSTLTSNITGGVPCPGYAISFTCIHNPPEDILRWRILRSGSAFSSVQFSSPFNQPPAERQLSSNQINGAANISFSPNISVVSTLIITVMQQLDGNEVECAGSTSVERVVINTAGMI